MTEAFSILDWHFNTQYKESEVRQHLGRIPLLLNPDCADPVWLQVQTNYPQGWQPVVGDDRSKWTLTGDDYLVCRPLPPIAPVAMAWHGPERVLVYPAGWMVVVTLGGDFTVARVMP